MSSRMNREHERNVRSNDFLQENIADFAANVFAAAQIAALNDKITEIGDWREEQISSDGGARQNYDIADDAEDDLKDAMRDVADFAGTFADEVEGVEEKFRIPRNNSRRNRIARARAFAADAEPLKAQFVGRGLDDDFIEDLLAKADALENALSSAVSETAKRVGATGRVSTLVKESSKIINSVDPIARKLYRNNPAKLAAWIFASHIQRDPQPKPAPTNNPPA